MRNKTLLSLAAVSLAFIAGNTTQAQPYSNAVIALNPVAYWPLNESTQPPWPIDLTAHNLGSLGSAGNGFYGAWYQPSGNTWYLTNSIVQSNAVTFPFDGSKAMYCQRAPGQYVVVPRSSGGVVNNNLTLNPPFTIEAWLQIGTVGSALGTVVSQGGFVNLNTGGPNPANPYYGGLGTGWAGVALGQYQDYLFLICNATNGQSKANELDTSGYNQGLGFHVGDWVHVVATFDGTTEAIWTNGVFSVQKNVGANAAGVKYVADPTTPLMIGSGSDVSASYGIAFQGGIHDVAIYNTVLAEASIANHFQTAYGTNATYGSVYTNAVLADSPVLYYRLNDAPAAANVGYPSGTFPVATNYGLIGAAGAGVYQPGTTPGLAGPNYAGFGAGSKSVGINGFLGAVDVGNSNLPPELNPTGYSPLTVVTWFKGGPADAPGRFQEMVGHGDSSYRLALGQTAGDNHFNPGPGPELQFASPADVATNGFALNDGKWHMAAGVCDGTNDYLYLDGVLAKSGSNPSGINIVGSTADLLLGGDRQYTYASANTANTIRNFDGQVAQVAFWTNALSPAQIQQLYGAAAVPPIITLQPQSLTNNAGTTATFTVAVRGSSPFSYQWYKNGSQISGATGSSLVFNPVTLANAGNYFVTVANGGGSVTSVVAQLTVYSAPVVVQQSPTPVQVFVGTAPTLRVSVIGPSPAYQWSKDGSPITGATASSYAPSTATTGTHSYTCTITNSFGPTSISPISLTVISAPTANYPVAVLGDHPVSYYRLGESSGTTAYDSAGGLNATYTNALLGQPGYSANDPTETSALFGQATGYSVDSFAGYVSSFLNFGAPAGSSSTFSVEAWANGGFGQNLDAGIVTLGYGNGGEQFDLDTGASDPSHNLRFIVRDAAGSAHVVNGTVGPHDGNWHHLVGVCDQANGSIKLYVDGLLNNSAPIGTNAGILSWSAPLSIGSRQSAVGTEYDNQFNGNVNDVSIYNYALNSGQVQAHYFASGVAPFITQQPADTTVNEGSSAHFTVTALGTAPLAYQWYDVGAAAPIAGATTSSLTLPNVTISMSGDSYYAVVTNVYGQVQSSPAALTVIGGAPSISVDISPLFSIGYAGSPISFSVTANGSAPLHYQWVKNSAPIAGATQSTYSFTSLVGTNTYAVTVTNNYGTATSSTAKVIGFAAPTLNPSDYTYKMKITFAGYNRGETLPNFQALVNLSTNVPGFAYAQFASPTGGDLRFTDASGTREIPHEIDEWNTSATSTIWVQVPSLAGTNDAIWAYWGNPAATAPLPWSTNGETWVPAFGGTPSFTSVYHLKESAAPYADSTLAYPGTTTSAPIPGPGIVGVGEALAGGNFVDQGVVTLSNQFSVSTWVNVSPTANSIQTVWGNSPGGFSSPGYRFYINNWNTHNGALVLESGNGTSGIELDAPANLVTPGQWHMVNVVVDHDAGTAKLYVDGALQASGNSKNDAPLNTDANWARFTDGAFPYNGTMDEARICTTTNSDNRIWADYMTVAQNSTLESYSSVTSSAVTVTFTRSGSNLILSWPQGTLQSAPQLTGPYNDINGANSPYTVPLSGPQQYFRVRVR